MGGAKKKKKKKEREREKRGENSSVNRGRYFGKYSVIQSQWNEINWMFLYCVGMYVEQGWCGSIWE